MDSSCFGAIVNNAAVNIFFLKRIFYFFKKVYLFIYLFIYLLFLAALGLCCCAWAFSSCGEQGLHFVAVRGLLTVVASPVVEHRL